MRRKKTNPRKGITKTQLKAKAKSENKVKASIFDEPESIFIPQYNEISLFLMSFTFLLMFFTYPGFASNCMSFIGNDSSNSRIIITLILFISGLFLSIFHVFTDRKKNNTEKYAMLFFAILVNGLSGIAAGMHDLEHSEGALMTILPTCNLVSASLLLILFRFDVIDISSIEDDNASSLEVFFGIVVTVMLVIICQFALEMHWSTAFSTCVVYATNVNSQIQRFINA